jgi:hypothetical protein
VPADFRTRVPIYLDYGNDKTGRLGTLALVGATSTKVNVEVPLPQKPRRVFINGYHDVLAR